MKKITIVGAGLGGLSAAIKLAHAGYAVTIYEKEAEAGGKLRAVTLGEYRFDLGPSTITMKAAFESVFTAADRKLKDYLDFYPIQEGTRNFFRDGTIVDFSTDKKAVKSQLGQFSKQDAEQYPAFLQEAKKLYDLSNKHFFSQLVYPIKTKLSPVLMKDFIQMRPFKTVDNWTSQYFQHPNTRMLFNRYATYIGSSPYQAPMIFGMMAHLEGNQGVWGVKGGSYQIVNAFVKLAEEIGVTIQYNQKVESFIQENKVIKGVVINRQHILSDAVIMNADALSVYHYLMPEHPLNKKLLKKEVSLSGFVLLLGIKKTYPELRHHNVFFPEDYEKEFTAIFDEQVVPEQPTIYICQSSYSEKERATPGGGNWFVLINAPYLTDKVEWDRTTIEKVTQRVLNQLKAFGFEDIEERIEERETMTPEDLKNRTAAYKGSIYGMSSNSFNQAFFRIANKDSYYENLYFVGGSTHPGGGTPMVTLSGQLVADDIIKHSNA